MWTRAPVGHFLAMYRRYIVGKGTPAFVQGSVAINSMTLYFTKVTVAHTVNTFHYVRLPPMKWS